MNQLRVASAVDVHAFADDDRPLMMACMQLADSGGLAGHSDADVAAHAAADAILIAAGIGELGSVFGTSDPQWAQASGTAILSEAVRLVIGDGWQICNISVQVIGEKPRMSPHKKAAEEAMSVVVGAPVMVSATTTDKLGFLGREEGVAALATALLTRD